MKLSNYIAGILLYIITLFLLVSISCSKKQEYDPTCFTCINQYPDTNINVPPLDLISGQDWVITQYSVQNQINPLVISDTLEFDDSLATGYLYNGDSSSYYLYKPQPLNIYTLRLNNTPWGDIQNSTLAGYNITSGQIPGLEFVNIYNQSRVTLWIQKIN